MTGLCEKRGRNGRSIRGGTMKTRHVRILVIAVAVSSIATVCAATPPIVLAQAAQKDQKAQQDLKGMEASGQRDDMTPMTAAQQAQYKAEYQAAKAKWASLTPQEQAAAIASARQKKIMDLTAIERVGQRNDMLQETAAQSGALKAEADAARASWDKMTPQQKQAVRKASWAKKRAELNGIERVGQRDDTDILPW
jgi:hypothetical protein